VIVNGNLGEWGVGLFGPQKGEQRRKGSSGGTVVPKVRGQGETLHKTNWVPKEVEAKKTFEAFYKMKEGLEGFKTGVDCSLSEKRGHSPRKGGARNNS